MSLPKPKRLPSGKWRVQWYDSEGKRRSATFVTESAAKAGVRRALVEVDDIRAGRARKRSDQTVRQAAEEWLANRPAKRLRDNTSQLNNHILPFLGDKKLTALNQPLIRRFIRHLEGKKTARKGEKNKEGRRLRPNSVKNILITLNKMLNDLEYPMKIKYKVPTETYSWLRTTTDVARFLEACRGDWFQMAAELAVYAGLRKGEIAGLTWSAIDFERGMIRVSRSYDGPTKSKHARWIPLAPELATRLKRWRMGNGGILVVTRKGAPITPNTDTAGRCRRICRRAGVPEVKFHELRDTYASHLAERVSLPVVGAVLGHVDPKTTARYAHIDTESLARDPRLHLNFAKSSAKLLELDPDSTHTAHDRKTKKTGTSN